MCGAGVAASATAYHECGRQMDGRTTLVSFEGGAIACTGKRAGGVDCFERKARAGEEMTLLGEDDNGDPPGP